MSSTPTTNPLSTPRPHDPHQPTSTPTHTIHIGTTNYQLLTHTTHIHPRPTLPQQLVNSMRGDVTGKEPLWSKVLSGGLSGGVGSAISNPFDLLKVGVKAV